MIVVMSTMNSGPVSEVRILALLASISASVKRPCGLNSVRGLTKNVGVCFTFVGLNVRRSQRNIVDRGGHRIFLAPFRHQVRPLPHCHAFPDLACHGRPRPAAVPVSLLGTGSNRVLRGLQYAHGNRRNPEHGIAGRAARRFRSAPSSALRAIKMPGTPVRRIKNSTIVTGAGNRPHDRRVHSDKRYCSRIEAAQLLE